MIREEQIKQQAMSVIGVPPELSLLECFRIGFKKGAKWADEHPQLDKETFIEKACWWLRETAHFYVSDFTGELDDNGLIEDFKKAMKEE